MLKTNNQKTSFEQFLFLHFDFKKNNKSVLKTDSRGAKEKKTKISACKPNNEHILSSDFCSDKKNNPINKIIKKTKNCESQKNTSASLTEAIDSIPENIKSLNIKDIAHKHESEWYHTFRDLQEKIARDLSKKHPGYNGALKLKSEIKEFWEQLDELIEKVILRLETIFQAFPNMSRMAVIYLLSIIIAVPLVFFSINHDDQMLYNTTVLNKKTTNKPKIIKLTKEIKSDYIAKNSARILSSGKTIIQVTKGTKLSRVAGAYEEKKISPKDNQIKKKIFAYYEFFSELKNEFVYFVKNKLDN